MNRSQTSICRLAAPDPISPLNSTNSVLPAWSAHIPESKSPRFLRQLARAPENEHIQWDPTSEHHRIMDGSYACVSICIYTHTRICVYVYVYTYVFISMYICIHGSPWRLAEVGRARPDPPARPDARGRETCGSRFPDPGRIHKVDPPIGFHNLHHRSIGAQNWGIYFFGSSRGSGSIPVLSPLYTP